MQDWPGLQLRNDALRGHVAASQAGFLAVLLPGRNHRLQTNPTGIHPYLPREGSGRTYAASSTDPLVRAAVHLIGLMLMSNTTSQLVRSQHTEGHLWH